MIKIINKVIITAFLSFCMVFTAQTNVCAVKYIDGRFPTNRQFRAIMAKKVRGKSICKYFSRKAHEPVSPDTSKIILCDIKTLRNGLSDCIIVDVPIVTVKGEFVQSVCFEISFKSEIPTHDVVKMLFYSNECKEKDFTWYYSYPCGGEYGSFKPRSFPPAWTEYSSITMEEYYQDGFLEEIDRAHIHDKKYDSVTWWRLMNMQFFQIVRDEIVPVCVIYYAS